MQNYTEDESVSFEDCYNNNWWMTSELYNFEDILDPEGAAADSTDKALLETFMTKAGSPNYFSMVLSPYEDFKETRHNDNSQHNYFLGWIFDDYVILVSVFDSIFYDENTVKISYVAYMTREWWDYQQNGPVSSASLDYSHNDIDRLIEDSSMF